MALFPLHQRFGLKTVIASSYQAVSGSGQHGIAELETQVRAVVDGHPVVKNVYPNEEKIKVDRITGHGGLFNYHVTFQRILAAAVSSPISVMETAGEGGAWGIALLGSYLVNNEKKQSLAAFLEDKVFTGDAGIEISPTAEDVAGFNTYIENYKAGLPVEEAATQFKK